MNISEVVPAEIEESETFASRLSCILHPERCAEHVDKAVLGKLLLVITCVNF